MFDFENLVIWGVPWLGIVRAFLDFLTDNGVKMSEKLNRAIFALLGAGGFVLSQNMSALYTAWPPLKTYGPQAIMFVAGFLFLGGYLNIQSRVATVQARVKELRANFI